MKKFFNVVFIVFLFNISCFSQSDLFFNTELGLGSCINKYEQERKILSSRGIGYHGDIAISLQYRAFDRIGLEIGGAQNFQNYGMKDKKFASEPGKFAVKIRNKNSYFNFFINLQYFQKLNESFSLYGELGYVWNFVGSKTLGDSAIFSKDNSPSLSSDEIIKMKSVYNSSNNYIHTEIGIQNQFSDNAMMSYGINLNIGKGNMMQGIYTVSNPSGALLYSDKFTSYGTYLGFTIKYSGLLFHRDKPEKKIKPLKELPKETPVIAVTPTPIPKQVEGREVTVTHKIEVRHKKVTIKVWDHQKVDGDRISLNLNGKWILENYTLEKKQYVFEVELNDGTNYFVLHALNLGEYPPNTAAIIVEDGNKDNEVILESTLQTSGTIEITVK